MNELLNIVQAEWLRSLVEVLLLAFVFYQVLMLIRGTRAIQVIFGLIFLWAFYKLAGYLNLYVLSAMMEKFWLTFFLAVLILFQPELRRMLAQIGQRGLLMGLIQEKHNYINEIVKAACNLSQKRVGALIVIEREASLDRFVESGVRIDSIVDAKLVQTIFSPYTPLHDGAAMVQAGRLSAAACLLPLTERSEVEPELGTRHRAAIGLTEEMDALVVVVSEETGNISLAEQGKLIRGLDEETLSTSLRNKLGFIKKNEI